MSDYSNVFSSLQFLVIGPDGITSWYCRTCSILAHVSMCYMTCHLLLHGPLSRYVKLQVAHAPGMPGTFFPPPIFQGEPLVSDPGTHHGTCVTHVPLCMSGSLTRGGGENVPGIPSACANRNFMYLARGQLHTAWVSHVAWQLLSYARTVLLCHLHVTNG